MPVERVCPRPKDWHSKVCGNLEKAPGRKMIHRLSTDFCHVIVVFLDGCRQRRNLVYTKFCNGYPPHSCNASLHRNATMHNCVKRVGPADAPSNARSPYYVYRAPKESFSTILGWENRSGVRRDSVTGPLGLSEACKCRCVLSKA